MHIYGLGDYYSWKHSKFYELNAYIMKKQNDELY